ncbi:MAG TPA: tetratricopeptide repeat protein [Opitutaceae bacterium]|nr:tetratricopeptide repeat protein [Opitutaceae bacterium]
MSSSSALLASAVAHHRAGRLDEAAAIYRQVLTGDPRQPDALHLLGQIALHRNDAALAESLFTRALAVLPNVAPLHLQHGLALRALRRPDDALAAFQRASGLDPKLGEAHHQAGNVLKSLGRLPEAVAALQQAAKLVPDSPVVWLNLGVATLEAGDTAEAITRFRRALALEPARAETHNILGHALAAAGKSAEAHAAFAEALRLRPGYAAAHDNLGRLCKTEGRLASAIEHYRAALASAPSPATHSNLLLALNYLPEIPPAAVFAEHRQWHEAHAASLAPPAKGPVSPAAHAAPSGRRLRVGYLSPDFVHHAVAYFIEPVLAAHDRNRVEVFCYSNVLHPDGVTARLRGQVEHWREIARLDDDAAADLVRRDELDLLVDLAGHTANHRLLVFARRPAPVQVTWIGYPNTTGLDAIDCRITDAISDPPGKTEAFHSEKLLRLPTTFSCYRPDDNAPPVNALPASKAGAITFGCFNNFSKVTPAVLGLWSRLLRELPASRLLLKSRAFSDPDIVEHVHAAFAAEGVASRRVSLHGADLSVRDHLSLYHGVDVALDPFPYNGTTTTCEALWMGVPVITLAGRVHAARVGASLLTHAGMADWIASSPNDYVRLSVAAAQDLPRLAELRRTLRDRLRLSPLCDAPRFTRGLEDAFFAMARPG